MNQISALPNPLEILFQEYNQAESSLSASAVLPCTLVRVIATAP